MESKIKNLTDVPLNGLLANSAEKNIKNAGMGSDDKDAVPVAAFQSSI